MNNKNNSIITNACGNKNNNNRNHANIDNNHNDRNIIILIN